MRIQAFLLAGLGSACLNAAAQDGAIRFTRDIVPIFKSRCVMCHLPGAELGKLALHPKAAYANLVGVPSADSPLLRVAPGNPEASYLYRKVTGTQIAAGGTGERMPFGEPPLNAAQLEAIRRWIESGAKAD
jgi:hypothetical protein